MGIRPLKSKENFRTYISDCSSFLSSCYCEEATHCLSVKISYTLPEVGGTRFTTQNDRERLLYMLVGPKVMIIGVNRTVLIDICKVFQKKSRNISKKSDFFGFLNNHIIKLISDSENSGNFTLRT